MKKTDIKPGVVYAYRRGRDNYYPPQPIVFLSAPSDGKLYQERDRVFTKGSAFSAVSYPGAKPESRQGFGGRSVGYAAVKVDGRGSGKGSDDLLAVTLADFEATRDAYHDGLEFMVVTSLSRIVGTYDEAMAEHAAQRQTDREREARAKQERDEHRQRAEAVEDALSAHGITARRDGPFGVVKEITISLDDAEKLVELLRDAS